MPIKLLLLTKTYQEHSLLLKAKVETVVEEEKKVESQEGLSNWKAP